MDLSVNRAEELARIGRENDLAELEYEDSEVKIHLTFDAPPAASLGNFDSSLLAQLANSQVGSPAGGSSAPTAVAEIVTTKNLGETINSPLAGVFYRCPNPDASPFVSEGDNVTNGQSLCIVEAMKLMNEIAAERPCKIAKILVEDAEAVEEGQPLFVIE